MDKIHGIIEADKLVPVITEFVDITGLVKGASKVEVLGIGDRSKVPFCNCCRRRRQLCK